MTSTSTAGGSSSPERRKTSRARRLTRLRPTAPATLRLTVSPSLAGPGGPAFHTTKKWSHLCLRAPFLI